MTSVRHSLQDTGCVNAAPACGYLQASVNAASILSGSGWYLTKLPTDGVEGSADKEPVEQARLLECDFLDPHKAESSTYR